MLSDDFNTRIEDVKTMENRGDFIAALRDYLALSSEGLDPDQKLIVSIARATCFLRMKMVPHGLEEVRDDVPKGTDPTVRAMYLSLRAQCLHELGRFAEAATTAEEALVAATSIPSGDNEILCNIKAQKGFTAAELGHIEEALSLLNDASERCPSSENALSIAMYKAMCFEKRAEYKRALLTLAEYDAANPDSASRDMVFFMGTMWYRLGNMREASHCFGRAQRLEPTGKIDDADIFAALDLTKDQGYGAKPTM